MLCNKFFKELNLHEGLLAYDYHVDFIASIHIGDKYHRWVDVYRTFTSLYNNNNKQGRAIRK